MNNIERDIAGEIVSAGGRRAATLGLRFDRVVVRVLGDLRSFAQARAPSEVTVLVTITAPIRLPARTVEDIEGAVVALLAEGGRRGDEIASYRGNSVRLRLVERSGGSAQGLIGFVHNPDSAPEVLLDMAERWLRGQG